MDSTANHQWLAELENEEVGELDFMDPLTMLRLAESLADELWDLQAPQEQQVEILDQRQQRTNTTGGFPFPGDMSRCRSYTEAKGFPTAINAAGSNTFFSFTDDGKPKQLSFSSREPEQESNVSITAGTPPLTMTMESSKGGRSSGGGGVHEHVISERKRREKMNQQFAALTSIIPDITKTDKVSLLGSTIDYVHHLRGRLKALQEEQQRRAGTGSTAESPPLDARCCIGSSLDDDGDVVSPKIEADVRGTTVLLRVVCREKKGVLIMVLKELEKHGLSTINTNVLLLTESSSLNITITAQIEDGFSTAVELVNNLNDALKTF